MDVIPPPAPASVPQSNCPVVVLYISLSAEPEQEESPAPNIYPELSCSPLVTSTPPAKVDVADNSPLMVVVAVPPT